MLPQSGDSLCTTSFVLFLLNGFLKNHKEDFNTQGVSEIANKTIFELSTL